MVVRAMIVDDEELARNRIKVLLREEPEIEVVAECADGRQAVAVARSLKPDLMFLDIQMPEVDGFGVLTALGEEERPAVIFITAHDRYALDAFEAHAVDYLLKPFSRIRFEKALRRARLHIGREKRDQVDQRLASLLMRGDRPSSLYLDRLVIKSPGRVTFLRTQDVQWIEACANYVHLHVGKESHLMREKINVLEARLDPAKFVRIHRSSIVRIDQVKELRVSGDGEHLVVLQDGSRLSLSRGYHQRFRQSVGIPSPVRA